MILSDFNIGDNVHPSLSIHYLARVSLYAGLRKKALFSLEAGENEEKDIIFYTGFKVWRS